MTRLNYSYMIISPSPWPLTAGISLLSLLLGTVMYLHAKIGGLEVIILSLISTLISAYKWWEEVIIEGTYMGEHTKKVQELLTTGFILFVVSEACIFFSLFFAYFYNALIPSIEVGGLWPPVGIETLDVKAIPLLNTIILFSSGITVTATQNYIVASKKNSAVFYLILTIILGSIFVYFQYYEYLHNFFTISDSVYGSSFFMITGFHGLHVIVGLLFLGIALIRLIKYHFTETHFLNATFSNLYYHFVDAVWVVVYGVIYIWGGGLY